MSAAVPPHVLRILVVDDNAGLTDTLTAFLRGAGYEVRPSGDGPAALLALRDWEPDVVLLDLGLPGMNGYELAKRIRERPVSHKPLLVALTGHGTAEDRLRSLSEGIDLHLLKPADPAFLLDLLKHYALSEGRA
jgi:CheY-like chemotaxis protein